MSDQEKHHGESALAFSYFIAYRDMSPIKRGLRRLTELEINGKKRDLKTIGRWSTLFRWQARVKSFDKENRRQAVTAIAHKRQAEIEAFIEADLAISTDFQALIQERLTELKQSKGIRELRQLALAYRESRLWLMDLINIVDDPPTENMEGD